MVRRTGLGLDSALTTPMTQILKLTTIHEPLLVTLTAFEPEALSLPDAEVIKTIDRDRLCRRLSASRRTGCRCSLVNRNATPESDATAWLPEELFAGFAREASSHSAGTVREDQPHEATVEVPSRNET